MKKADLLQSLQNSQRLIEISRDLASTLDLDTLLRRIINVAKDLSQSEVTSLLLYDENKKQLYFQAATNSESEAKLRGIIVPTDSIAGWVALNRQSLIVPDAHQDQRFFPKVEMELNYVTHSILAIPLIVKDKLIGVLEALNKIGGQFTRQDLESLSVLGAQAAIAIENSRLFHQWDLIAELVHEVRTPLTSISTISYLLEREGVPEQQRLNLAKIIRDETTRLEELTTTFLDLSRLESGRESYHPTLFDPCKLAADCCKIVQPKANENGICFIIDLPKRTASLEADRDKIKQVLLNLLSNAIKYNHPAGKVTIKCWSDEQSVYYSVEDTGIGIAEEDIAHLFDKFYRAHDAENITPGTGLGLLICKRIVESHGGTITVASKLNSGTTITFQLPLTSSQIS
jgi:signal transduction histidine kinase